MVDVQIFQTISIVMAATSMVVAATYYILKIRIDIKTRQAQLFMDMYKEFVSESESGTVYLLMDMEYDDYEDFERKFGHDNNPEANNMITRHMMLMEGFGVLVREEYVSVRLVTLLTSGTIKLGWEKMKGYIYEVRKRNNMPRWSIEYEYLYNKVMEYAEQHPELQIK